MRRGHVRFTMKPTKFAEARRFRGSEHSPRPHVLLRDQRREYVTRTAVRGQLISLRPMHTSASTGYDVPAMYATLAQAYSGRYVELERLQSVQMRSV
jgi:hypothetical protein